MKRQITVPLLLALGLTFSGATAAADAIGKASIYAKEDADGSVVLSNISSADNQEVMVTAPNPTASAAPESKKAAEPNAVTADAPKDPREQYRDNVLQGAAGTPAENPAVSRRYKMMDRAAYRATVLGIAPQIPEAPATAQ